MPKIDPPSIEPMDRLPPAKKRHYDGESDIVWNERKRKWETKRVKKEKKEKGSAHM